MNNWYHFIVIMLYMLVASVITSRGFILNLIIWALFSIMILLSVFTKKEEPEEQKPLIAYIPEIERKPIRLTLDNSEYFEVKDGVFIRYCELDSNYYRRHIVVDYIELPVLGSPYKKRLYYFEDTKES